MKKQAILLLLSLFLSHIFFSSSLYAREVEVPSSDSVLKKLCQSKLWRSGAEVTLWKDSEGTISIYQFEKGRSSDVSTIFYDRIGQVRLSFPSKSLDSNSDQGKILKKEKEWLLQGLKSAKEKVSCSKYYP